MAKKTLDELREHYCNNTTPEQREQSLINDVGDLHFELTHNNGKQ